MQQYTGITSSHVKRARVLMRKLICEMKHFILLLFLLALAGCASSHRTSTTRIDRDSTYRYTRQLDSLYRAFWQRDSVYRRDSIYILEKADTVTKFVEKTLYKWRTRTDTIYRDRWRTDTLYIERADSVIMEKPVYTEKPIKWYNQGFMWIGKMCCIAIILWAVFLYVKQKF